MDGDLQHDPAEIPLFLAKLEEGYDVVSGWRSQRGDNVMLAAGSFACGEPVDALVVGRGHP